MKCTAIAQEEEAGRSGNAGPTPCTPKDVWNGDAEKPYLSWGLGMQPQQWVYGGTGTTFDLVKAETLITVPSPFFPDQVRMSLGARVFLISAGFAAGR